MKTKIEKGVIVKFINSNGILDGGTIVSITKDADGTEYAALNTLEGANVRVKVANLTPIKHQRKGVVSEKFKKRIAKEIADYNQSRLNPSSESQYKIQHKTERIGLTPQQLEIKMLKEKVEILEEENEKLRNEIKVTKCPYETEMLIKTVKALNQSINDGIILSDDKNQAIVPLLNLILEFNKIEK